MASNVELNLTPSVKINGEYTHDIHTQRPRTPNVPYSTMTETQVRNIKKDPHAFFMGTEISQEDDRRRWVPRFVNVTSRHLVSRYPPGQDFCWIDEMKSRVPNPEHNASRPGAFIPWGPGPGKMGERTVSHFSMERRSDLLPVEMVRRPPTNMPGDIIMKYGRPNKDYYSQRYPDSTTWFLSNHQLNKTEILRNIQPKTRAQYSAIRAAERDQGLTRLGQHPEFTEYTDRYTLGRKILPRLETRAQTAA